MTFGSRRTRVLDPPCRLTSSSARGAVSGFSRPSPISSSSTPPSRPPSGVLAGTPGAAGRAAVGRIEGHAERGGLAVHRPPGGDDDVGEGDQALRVDGTVGDEQRRQVEPSDEPALLLGSGEDDRLYLRVGTEEVERLW